MQLLDVAFASGIRKTATQQHDAFTGAYTKESRNNTLPSPVVPTKTVTQQRVAFTGGKRKTITQQHVTFTSGTRKSSHSTTRYRHQWKAQSKTRNNTLSSLVVHAKQSHNYTLPSPGAHAKNSHATSRCLQRWYTQNSHATTRFLHQWYTQKTVTQQYVACPHRWNTQIITQRYVALTSGHARTACCPHRWYSQKQRRNNRLLSPVEYNNSHATTHCIHWWNTTVTSTQLPKPAVRQKKRHATT